MAPTRGVGAVHRQLDHGTAYVRSVRSSASGVEAILVYPAGRSDSVVFDCVLREEDGRVPAGVSTVLAVHIRSRPSELGCRLLGIGQDGSRSFPITLEQALALAEGGVHTVVSADRDAAC